MAYFIPWSWVWKRGIVIIFIGGIVFTLLYSDPPHFKDPPPAPTRYTDELFPSAETFDDYEPEPRNPNSDHLSNHAKLLFCPPCSAGIVSPLNKASRTRKDDSKSPDRDDIHSRGPDNLSGDFDNSNHLTNDKDPSPLSLSVGYRRRIARTIANIERQISRVAGRHALVDAKWSLVLKAISEELDPRRIQQDKVGLPGSQEGHLTESQDKNTSHVCPEAYKGKRYDHPFYQRSIEITKCSNVPSFSMILTAVLPALNWSPNRVTFVISKIRELYDIPIIAIVSSRTALKLKYKNVKILVAKRNIPEGALLNGLEEMVKTPYILLGTSLAHFNNQSSLERLVRILDEVEFVKVVSGVSRDEKGHWIHGCLQQDMGNYRATYTLGYYHSNRECMYCDDLLSPFVTSRKFMTSVQFTDSLNGPALYRDWFAKIREAGNLVMACPDVMFYVDKHVSLNFSDWHLLASQWKLQQVKSYTNELFSFSCESVNIKCDNLRTITKSFLLPPCCITEAYRNIGFLNDFAHNYHLEYELQAGSVLGAVKFGSFLPWDLDHDVFIDCKNFKTWTNDFGSVANSYNCTPKVKYKNSFLKIVCHSFTMDLLCKDHLSNIFLPPEYQKTPTSIFYGGRWTKVISNPGLFSRNSIGSEILKHKQHSTHFTDSGASQSSPVQSGEWLPCRTPSHHSCLDRYPPDGNLPFL